MTTYKGFGELGAAYGIKPSPEPPPPKKAYQPQRNNPSPKKSSLEPATAPYNFVPLPEKILSAEFDGTENFRAHIAERGKLSGEILLDITTLTPLFIGGNLSGNGSKSFAPVGTPIIPGSSLRGMFKNIFKIVTCGAFRGRTNSQRKGEDFNDEHIYFRCLMGVGRYPWTKDLNKVYTDRMTEKNSKIKKARPGFLIRTTDNEYFIAPAIADGKPMNHDRKNDYTMIKTFQDTHYNIGFRDCGVHWDDENRAYIITGNQHAQKPEKLLDESTYEKYKANLKSLHNQMERGEITENDYDKEARKHGKQIIRFTSLYYVDWCRDHWFPLPEDVLTSYKNDRNRHGVDLFKDKGILNRDELKRRLKGETLSDVKTLIPCHFLVEDGQVTAFGHGQCFRIPYQRRIGDAVPKTLQDEKIVDFADAVFGKEKFWASRVYFEDATPIGEVRELATAPAHPLMQPNPTSYQLYLDQRGDKLKHWDTNGAQIRGYKLYWHKPVKDSDWHANQSELNENDKRIQQEQDPLTKDMTPLAEGSRFTAKIRFKNLSVVELGALMMVFDLDGLKDAAYKIGKGKPFGFGSVRITPTLYVEDDAAYTQLFGADGWQAPCREENPAAYVDAFRKYLTARGAYDTWRDVMRALKIILDWSRTNRSDWSERVKSMSGDVSQKDGVDERFKQRVPLPSIFEVVK